MQIDIPAGYESLGSVLQLAVDQAAKGKGLSRHATGEPFDEQKICRISRAVGVGFALGQAEKKIEESVRLPVAAALAELLGAINYTAAGYIVTAESLADAMAERGQGSCERSPVAGSLADIVGVKG